MLERLQRGSQPGKLPSASKLPQVGHPPLLIEGTRRPEQLGIL